MIVLLRKFLQAFKRFTIVLFANLFFQMLIWWQTVEEVKINLICRQSIRTVELKRIRKVATNSHHPGTHIRLLIPSTDAPKFILVQD